VIVTEKSIRQRLAQDKEKVSRLPTWEEIEYLLHLVDSLRQDIRLMDGDLRLMEENLHRLEGEQERMNWL
jgi:predicted  nucleic acid-binding Zn-ribbon protein